VTALVVVILLALIVPMVALSIRTDELDRDERARQRALMREVRRHGTP